ncbi:MAG TPA: GtrA family protein [Nocardioides sp.]|jgi:putative flippase GtrA|nr:GtrA family protein [Nocardioides sp.]
MPDVAEGAERLAPLEVERPRLPAKVLRFGTGSVVATVCSQTTFLLVYGPAGASTTTASVLAWFAGAIPNYWINRSWTWGRRGRPSVRRELLPYAAIILGTLVLAIVATAAMDDLLDGTSVSDEGRTLLVTGTYFAVYAVMFVVRFLLFDRLFTTEKTEATD